MSREMSMYALAGYLKRISELPEEQMLKARPRELRKICIVDNKHNPDFYVVGLIVAFLGIEFICRWYPVLVKRDGREAFLKGIVDAGEDGFDFMDILGELWRVRRTDPPVFDAALYLKYGGVRQAQILDALLKQGPAELEKRKDEQAHEMEYYGFTHSRLLKCFEKNKEDEYGDSEEGFSTSKSIDSLIYRKSDYSEISEYKPKRSGGGQNSIEVLNGIPGVSKKCPVCGNLYSNSHSGISAHIKYHIRNGDAKKEDEISLRSKMIGYDIIANKKIHEEKVNAQL